VNAKTFIRSSHLIPVPSIMLVLRMCQHADPNLTPL